MLDVYDYLYAFIPLKKFLFSVNIYVFITMALFYGQNFFKIAKNRYTGEWLIIYMYLF